MVTRICIIYNKCASLTWWEHCFPGLSRVTEPSSSAKCDEQPAYHSSPFFSLFLFLDTIRILEQEKSSRQSSSLLVRQFSNDLIIFAFYNTGDRAQDLMHTGQVLCHWATPLAIRGTFQGIPTWWTVDHRVASGQSGQTQTVCPHGHLGTTEPLPRILGP